MLLRVGIDKGTDGCLAPIFSDGTFEYIPLSESDETDENRTYGSIKGCKGICLSQYLPEKVKNRKIHFDPEFETFTYGDKGSKAKSILKLNKGDLLVFYAGLTPFKHKLYDEALYIIGYFTVWEIVDFKNCSNKEKEKYSKRYFNNPHIKRKNDLDDLVIVVGDKNKSRLLDKAILISKKRLNKIGRTYHAVSKDMEELLGIKGSIQRSIPPRFIENKEYLGNLLNLIGYE
ncbi:MAG: hypothetical protein QMD61_00925 [Methanobacterium sp.]|nr:hypothetical protein [Methanobacterium sp.]